MTGMVRQAEDNSGYDDGDDEERHKVMNVMTIVKKSDVNSNLSSSAMYPPLPTTQSM